MNHIEVMKLALEAFETGTNHGVAVDKLRQAIQEAALQAITDFDQQAEQDHTYGYAKGLAEAIFKQHFASDEHYASGRIVWGVNDTVIGILTQIDNMVADMVRKPQQAEQAHPKCGAIIEVFGKDWRLEYLSLPVGKHKLYTQQYEYTALPIRKPLTDDEIDAIVTDLDPLFLDTPMGFEKDFARAIEAAHGIKGEA